MLQFTIPQFAIPQFAIPQFAIPRFAIPRFAIHQFAISQYQYQYQPAIHWQFLLFETFLEIVRYFYQSAGPLSVW